MPESNAENSLQHIQRRNEIGAAVAQTMTDEGLEAAIAVAQAQSGYLNEEYPAIMRLGSIQLLEQPETEEMGLAIMTWEATNFPDSSTGAGLAVEAEYEESRDLAHRRLEIAIMHFSTQAENDFAPDVYFIEHFSRAAASIRNSDFPELYSAVIAEFAPIIIEAARQDIAQKADTNRQADQDTVDYALSSIARELYFSDPETSRTAREMIQAEFITTITDKAIADRKIIAALNDDAFDEATAILKESGGLLTVRVLQPIQERVCSLEESDLAWGNSALNALLTAERDYFKSSLLHQQFGTQIGTIAGVLNRDDILEIFINPSDDLLPNAQLNGMAGLAYGYGLRGDINGFNHLKAHTGNLALSSQGTIEMLFKQGQKDSQKIQ